MSLVDIKKIEKSYGIQPVLSDVSFTLERGQKVALVGNNGTGKSTLLKIISGLEKPDSGVVRLQKGIILGYLPQDMSLTGEITVEECLFGNQGNLDIWKQLHSKEKSQIRVRILFSGFGLTEKLLSQPINTLSSGQKTKILLIKLLLQEPDIMLLDEPTNNLDMPALIWLEKYLEHSESACLVISHDRRFLDKIASTIMELDWHTHKIRIEHGRYSEYLKRQQERLRRQKKVHDNQEEEIRRLQRSARAMKVESAKGSKWKGHDNDKFLRGFKRDQAGSSARRAKAIEKRIDQMDKIEIPPDRKNFEIPLESEVKKGSFRVELTDAVAGYANGFILGPISLSLALGERMAILGLNGSGKSTLIKTISGDLELIAGERHLSSRVISGNLTQEHENLSRDETSFQIMKNQTNLEQHEIFSLLVKFGFSELQIRGEVKSLSPGGRARLLLALFTAQSVNLLVLDEPTNNLDLEAITALEEMMDDYHGAILLVSHDRYFLQKARLDTVLMINEGRLERIPDLGSYIKGLEQKASKMTRLLK